MKVPEICDECGSNDIKRIVIARIPTGPIVIGGETPMMEIAVYQCRECKSLIGLK